MNIQDFEHELENLPAARKRQARRPSKASLVHLQAELREAHKIDSRTQQHESWAWTRLRSQMRLARARGRYFESIFWRIAMPVVTVLVVGILIWHMSQFPDGKSSALQITSVRAQQPSIWAGAYRSSKVKGDWIWTQGLEYIPANKQIE